MTLYRYKAVDAAGKTLHGQIDALNLVDLELRLKRMGLDLVVGNPAKNRRGVGRGVKRRDLINFFLQLEQLTSAGVPMLEGLNDLRNGVDSLRFREVVSGLIEAIQGGQPLSGAMSHYPAAFDSVTRSLVRAGEETGRLQEVLRNLTDNLKWEDELAAHTKRIMIYPAIVATLLVAVIFFMMVHLVPQMTAFVGSMGRSIPPHTRLLIAVSDVFVRYGWAIVLVPALGILALKALAARNPLVRRRVDALKLHLPVAGPILQKVVLSRFISVFALMYSSGIPVTDAIRAAEDSAGNAAVQAGLRRVGLQIADGRNVTAAFQEVDLFPPLVVRMVQVGESTGALDRALLNVNYFYTREVREAIAKAQAMIEPALTVILGALMLWVMLSVLGPIYDTVSQIGI